MKASVIIPNLNGAGWLRDSIESVWAQTEQDFELIVVGGVKNEHWSGPAPLLRRPRRAGCRTAACPRAPVG